MLERTSTCLDAGLRLSLRAGKRATKSRRLLHSTFWNHGADQLDFSPWPNSVRTRPPSGLGNMTTQDNRFSEVRCGPEHEGISLDFLYPPQAPYFTLRSGATIQTREHRRCKGVARCSLRDYSSMRETPDLQSSDAKQVGQEEESEDYIPAQDGDLDQFADFPSELFYKSLDKPDNPDNPDNPDKPQIKTLDNLKTIPLDKPQIITLDKPQTELKRLLQESRQVTPKRIWTLYSLLNSKQQTDSGLLRDLVVWFSNQPADEDAAAHGLEIFERLEKAQRNVATYHAAVRMCLRQDDRPRARRLHKQGSSSKEQGSFGSNLLMYHAVVNRKWYLAVEVRDLYEAHRDKLADPGPHTLFDHLWEAPSLLRDIQSLVENYERRSGTDPNRPKVKLLLEPLLGQLAHSLKRIRRGQLLKRRHKYLTDLISTLNSRGLATPELNETFLIELLRVKENASNPGRFRLVSRTYGIYRKNEGFAPSRALLRMMLRYWKDQSLRTQVFEHEDFTVNLAEIEKDYTEHHGGLDRYAIFLFMELYARHGRVGHVQKYAGYYRDLHPQGLPDANDMWPLVYAHAIRRDAKGAVSETRQLKMNYGVEADLRWWNVLIYAHERVNDFDGMLAVFDEMREAGMQPDCFTFGPLISLYGKFGDVDGANQMLALAKQADVLPTTLMLNGLILAHVNSGDLGAAYQVFSRTQADVNNGQAMGSLTPCYNTIMTAHALRRALKTTEHFYHQMREHNVDLDENTFATLVQALCLRRQTQFAYRIVRQVMPRRDIRPTAFHYAIVMVGYINQGQPDKALQVHKDMEDAYIMPSISTRMAYFKARALVEHKAKSPKLFSITGGRLPSLRETINELTRVLNMEESIPYRKGIEPGTRYARHNVAEAGYFDFLVYIHGERRCFLAAKELFLTYTKRNPNTDFGENALPVRLLTALMSVHVRAREWDTVAKYWHLAMAQANSMRQVPQPPASLSDPDNTRTEDRNNTGFPGFGNIDLSSVATTSDHATHISPTFRFILSRPLRYYMIALASSDPPKLTEITSTVASLLASGYALDKHTWNEYIVHLCKASPPQTLLAFTLVERFLMDNWPGWRRQSSQRYSKMSHYYEGLQYIKALYLPPDMLMPEYRTMVYLTNALLELRRLEAMGQGARSRADGTDPLMNDEAGARIGTVAQIREAAPRTLSAVQSMPTVHDELQNRLIRGVN